MKFAAVFESRPTGSPRACDGSHRSVPGTARWLGGPSRTRRRPGPGRLAVTVPITGTGIASAYPGQPRRATGTARSKSLFKLPAPDGRAGASLRPAGGSRIRSSLGRTNVRARRLGGPPIRRPTEGDTALAGPPSQIVVGKPRQPVTFFIAELGAGHRLWPAREVGGDSCVRSSMAKRIMFG